MIRILMRLLVFGSFIAISPMMVRWRGGDPRSVGIVCLIGLAAMPFVALAGWLLKAAVGFVVSGEWERHAREVMDELEPRVRLSTLIAQRFQAQMIAREIEKKLRRDV
jgi:hypothetical protein